MGDELLTTVTARTGTYCSHSHGFPEIPEMDARGMSASAYFKIKKKKKNPQFNLFSRSYFYFLMGGRWSHLAFIPNPSGGYVRYKPQRENTVAVRGCEGQAPLGSLAPRPCTEVHGRKAALNEKGLWTLLFCRQRRTIQG